MKRDQRKKSSFSLEGALLFFVLIALVIQIAILTYDYIIRELWGPRASGDNQILRVNMANIRRKIEENPAEPRYLFTEVGVGYRMAESE